MAIVEGLALGLAYAMPLGAQNVFVIQQALKEKLPKSYLTSTVVTFIDVSLSLACLFGIGIVLQNAPILKNVILLLGSFYLFYLGIMMLKSNAHLTEITNQPPKGLTAIFVSALVLTWGNPHAWIDGTILFGGYRASLGVGETASFVVGMAMGSALWFFGLTTAVGIARHKIKDSTFKVINRFCGILLIFLGVKLSIEFMRVFK